MINNKNIKEITLKYQGKEILNTNISNVEFVNFEVLNCKSNTSKYEILNVHVVFKY